MAIAPTIKMSRLPLSRQVEVRSSRLLEARAFAHNFGPSRGKPSRAICREIQGIETRA